MSNPIVAYPFTSVVSLLSLYELNAFSFAVGNARHRLGVEAPKTTGADVPAEFERYNRVHLNTVENITPFLLSLWIFTLAGQKTEKDARTTDLTSGLLGLTWIIGRALFAKGYYKDAKARSAGFGIGFLAQTALLLGATVRVGKIFAEKYCQKKL